ncbi:MAG TPA: hypothetical protein VL972_09680 [Solirubrobacteraceae bacterium]|nr:hypothetical protein [Solirubrobacteraceae bacterium]
MALLTLAALALWALLAGAPAARAAFGVQEANFEAGTCTNPSCTYASVEANHGEAFTQAAGHPPWGLTAFELNRRKGTLGYEPEGAIKRLRVDVPPGLAADPQALPTCEPALFEAGKCPAEAKVGTTEMTAFVLTSDITISGDVYNLPPAPGLPLRFGVEVAPLAPLVAPVRLYLDGHDDWSGDYHEYFEIDDIPTEAEVLGGAKAPLEVLKSKLLFDGRAGAGNFLTLPSVCSSSTESHLEVESWEGQVSRTQTHTPVGVEGCQNVPFAPSVSLAPETAAPDAPDGATVRIDVPQQPAAGAIDDADVQDLHVTLPAGMTLNPAAAHGLASCSAGQIAIGGTAPVACPAGSRIGSVRIETDLPAGSLTGSVFLGSANGAPITGPPYTVYLDAESVYGVSVRLAGTVVPNPQTGRLEASFLANPPLPFSEVALQMQGGERAPLANPLACEGEALSALLTPYSGGGAATSAMPFAAAGCPGGPPFSLGQATQDSPATAGAYATYTFTLTRGDGQQFLAGVRTVLPPGLLGVIPSVSLCGEPQAAGGACPSSSQIGTASVSAGAGGEPYGFSGPVYLTGPYDGAPYGLSIPIVAAAGPFDLGTVLTRARIDVDPHSGRVIVTSALPTIVGGVPLRLRSIAVTVNRPSFIFNPTSCAGLAQESTLTSTRGAIQSLSSPFQASNCGALRFTPSFKVASDAHTSKAGGAELTASLTQPAHQGNIRSVFVELPKQLPARLTTLQKACPEAIYAADPRACPSGSKVGSATVTTPVLPGKLSGPAYLVSHGGEAFPDLDLLLEGDGVHVILVGNTKITRAATTSDFASIPDVPVSSFTLTLPEGPNSALAANGSLCASTLSMPTVITAQSGAQLRRRTPVAVAGCRRARVRIISRRRAGRHLLLRVRAYEPGRLTVGGRGLRTSSRTLRRAATVTLEVALTRASLRALGHHHRLTVRPQARLTPASVTETGATSRTTLTLRG